MDPNAKVFAILAAVEAGVIAVLTSVLKFKDQQVQKAQDEAANARLEAGHYRSLLTAQGKTNEELDASLRSAGVLSGSSLLHPGQG